MRSFFSSLGRWRKEKTSSEFAASSSCCCLYLALYFLKVFLNFSFQFPFLLLSSSLVVFISFIFYSFIRFHDTLIVMEFCLFVDFVLALPFPVLLHLSFVFFIFFFFFLISYYFYFFFFTTFLSLILYSLFLLLYLSCSHLKGPRCHLLFELFFLLYPFLPLFLVGEKEKEKRI